MIWSRPVLDSHIIPTLSETVNLKDYTANKCLVLSYYIIIMLFTALDSKYVHNFVSIGDRLVALQKSRV